MLHNPARGNLLWVGIASPPLTGWALFETKLYVCCQCVAVSVYEVVIYLQLRWQLQNRIMWTSKGCWYIKSDVVDNWLDAMRAEWHTLTPTSYSCCLREVVRMEVFQLVTSAKYHIPIQM